MSHSENENPHPEFLDQATLACLVERAGEMVIAFDPEFRILYANANSQQLLKPYSNTVHGRVLWDLFPDAVGRPTHQHYLRAMCSRIPLDFVEKSEILGRWYEHRCLPTD